MNTQLRRRTRYLLSLAIFAVATLTASGCGSTLGPEDGARFTVVRYLGAPLPVTIDAGGGRPPNFSLLRGELELLQGDRWRLSNVLQRLTAPAGASPLVAETTSGTVRREADGRFVLEIDCELGEGCGEAYGVLQINGTTATFTQAFQTASGPTFEFQRVTTN